MVAFEVPEVDYTRYTNRQLAAVPLAVLGVAILVIVGAYAATGAPADLGLAFTGGTEVQLTTDLPQDELVASFSVEPESVRPVQSGEGQFILIFGPEVDAAAVGDQAEAIGTVQSIQDRSPSFGQGAQTQALIGVVAAFVGMSVVVFLLFRTFVPSIAVVVSAFSDIVIPVALMNVFGIELSLGTVAALLMLIGYSVDSDLLLNNHVLRRRGGFYDSAYRAMRTGVTMTLTSISAMAVMAVVAYLFGIPLMPSIGIVLVFGLTADLMNTYMLNMSLLRWYKYEGVNR